LAITSAVRCSFKTQFGVGVDVARQFCSDMRTSAIAAKVHFMISDRSLHLAQTLVRMNTVSANSNLALIHFIRDELQALGVRSRLTWNADKTKANLFATLGEGKPGGIILSGHTDTVPWDGQDLDDGPTERAGARRVVCTAAGRPT
jgi:acetylornithine deacetylase/succinyl-diaminopimelate desuccinylase-like protein